MSDCRVRVGIVAAAAIDGGVVFEGAGRHELLLLRAQGLCAASKKPISTQTYPTERGQSSERAVPQWGVGTWTTWYIVQNEHGDP